MSMPATMPVMDMTGASGEDGCKGCLPGKMTVADCGLVCISLPAIITPVAAISAGDHLSPWRWHDEQVRRYPTEPPTAPPRSEG
jgi:hypothetical protein